MLFNSLHFTIFLPIVFGLYWFLFNKTINSQNLFLLLSSFVFYGFWDCRFLILLFFSISLDYYSGLKIYNSTTDKVKKIWLWISIIINLSFLGIFKYYNFFITSFASAFSILDINFNYHIINIILPVGISFYTFHGLSYVIDIYKNKIKPEKNWITYSLFVSFFPLLVAGPIERATHLLPQLKTKRYFNYEKAVLGLRQILWGLFKKIVIADNCALYVNQIFESQTDLSGITNLLGAFFFTIQIYCDFSGYSDIAIGVARLFNIELLKNFNYPYFSRNIAEFWRRWHISLSSWFKDYVYIPLGGSQYSMVKNIRNVFVIFILSGFWHGANWTFIFWGFLNALFILPSIIFKSNRNYIDIVAKGKLFPSIKESSLIFFTFLLSLIAWIFFRSPNIGFAFHFIEKIFSKTLFSAITIENTTKSIELLILILFLFIIEWVGREQHFALEKIENLASKPVRFIFYYLIIVLMFSYVGQKQEFIYFQF